MAKVNNTINKEENIMANNYSKMLKAELIQVTTLQKKDIKELNLVVENLTAQVEEYRTKSIQLTEANAAIISERDTYKLALDRYLNNTPVKDDNMPKAKKAETKPEYANAEQCQKDKDAEKNISNHHDKYPTAKQVDLICNILATRKYPTDQMPQINKLTKHTANKLIDFFKSIPVAYRDHTLAIKDLMATQHMTWDEACHSIKLINGQKAYNKLVAKYGTLPTLTYAYKVEK